jgi:ArsR family transcriptional regulator, lead/cadmium/zinc/bismuth-responsive transcriptional repressor
MALLEPRCDAREHRHSRAVDEGHSLATFVRAAEIFRALGDPSRLRILKMLLAGPLCVTDICEQMEDSMPAVSQRLKLLRSERLVSYRRQGKHVIYSLADQHITKLVRNGLAHAAEIEEPVKWKRNSTTKPS